MIKKILFSIIPKFSFVPVQVVGTVIFVQASVHSIMHLFNFGINIMPDPVKFVQITG